MKEMFIKVFHEEILDELSLESIKGGFTCTCYGEGASFSCTCYGKDDFNCVCLNAKFECPSYKPGFTDKPIVP